MSPFIRTMWATRLLPAILVASVVYLGGSLLTAPYSTESRETLQRHVVRLEENLAELRNLQSTLVSEAELLQRSADRVELEARRLGYYDDDVDVVRFEDATAARVMSPGTILARPVQPDSLVLYVRLAAGLSFLVTLLLQFLVQSSKSPPGYEIRRASR